ncbi:MAG: Ig-like domain-containing protein [Chloroflexi bacterium]|nr:Ig-like domain-containing protein [Chloroflexota bacterium]
MAKRILLTAAATLLLALLSPAAALAQQPIPQLVLGVQPSSPVGNPMVVAGYLLDPAGNPISGQTVAFSTEAEFMNTLGSFEIGQAVTDDRGLAYVQYVPKEVGTSTITARFAGNDVFAPLTTSSPLEVTEGKATYKQERPFRIPGADVRLVVVLLSGVWSLYLLVTVLFWLISRAGDRPPREAGGPQ